MQYPYRPLYLRYFHLSYHCQFSLSGELLQNLCHQHHAHLICELLPIYCFIVIVTLWNSIQESNTQVFR